MALLLDGITPVARARHRCNGCLGWVRPGERYRRQRIVEGGDAWTYKSHLLCWAASIAFRSENALLDDEWTDPWDVQVAVCAALTPLLWAPPPSEDE